MKVLLITAYPIQNVAPHRILAASKDLQVDTIYLADPNQNFKKGKEFINQGQFDIEVLDNSYRWKVLPNISPKPNLSGFWGLINPGLIRLVPKYDCIVVYGHGYFSFWMAISIAKLFQKKLIFTTDATYLESPDGSPWKAKLKTRFLPFLYNKLGHAVWVPSTESKHFLQQLGVVSKKIVITPYTVDNDYIRTQSTKIPKNEIRSRYAIPLDATVIVFCAKFIPRKRPLDALLAFKKAAVKDSILMMIGDGPLRPELEQLIQEQDMKENVRLVGLVKYSDLPSYYSASDILVFTSETEQFGLPVNEAMLCGLPVLISDRIGCKHDLVKEGENGYTYPCGDIHNLAEKMRELLLDTEKRSTMSRKSKEMMMDWSPERNAREKINSIISLFKAS